MSEFKEKAEEIITNYCQGINWLEFSVEDFPEMLQELENLALSINTVVGQSEQLFCRHCKGKGEYIDTHPERYGLKTCECQKAK